MATPVAPERLASHLAQQVQQVLLAQRLLPTVLQRSDF